MRNYNPVELRILKRYFAAIIDDGDYMNDWLTHMPKIVRGPLSQIGKIVADLLGT